MKTTIILVALLALPVLAAVPAAKIQLKLRQGMGEADVVQLLGEPDRVKVSTCGGKFGITNAWACKSWIYRSVDGDDFTVWFQELPKTSEWLLHSWE